MDTIIWDLGGVLVDWKTTYVYDENYFESLETRDYFFEHICTNDWNENQDAGYPMARATEDKIKEHPDWESAIRDFYGRWEDMLRGPLPETVAIFEQLRARRQYRFYALTNWSAETFPIALRRFDFLHWFTAGSLAVKKELVSLFRNSISCCSIATGSSPLVRSL